LLVVSAVFVVGIGSLFPAVVAESKTPPPPLFGDTVYTNVLMNENRRLYAAIGYEEMGRGTGAGEELPFFTS
jgi:hypothetical protein